MKALLDMPVSPVLLDILQAYGHTGVHAYQIGQSRASDEELLRIAREEGRIIVTADLDFPQLLALSNADGPGIVLFRGGNYSDAEMCDLLEQVLQAVPVATLQRSICVVDKRRIRVTPLPIKRTEKKNVE